MQRVTISLDEDLAAEFDELAAEQGYGSRSEAIRDLVRKSLAERRERVAPDADCVANLSYVYSHHTRALAQRLVEIGHANHDLVVASFHVHLDHDHCLESVMLKGRRTAVRALADQIRAERGVRFGELNLVTVARHGHHHDDGDHHHEAHDHLTPELR